MAREFRDIADSCRPAGIKTITLQTLEIAVRRDIDARQILAGMDFVTANANFASRVNQESQRLVMDLRSAVLRSEGKVEVTAEESVPADWWSAFKVRWFPDWLYRRYPPKLRQIKTQLTTYRLCPHVNVKLRDAHYHYLTHQPDGPKCPNCGATNTYPIQCDRNLSHWQCGSCGDPFRKQ